MGLLHVEPHERISLGAQQMCGKCFTNPPTHWREFPLLGWSYKKINNFNPVASFKEENSGIYLRTHPNKKQTHPQSKPCSPHWFTIDTVIKIEAQLKATKLGGGEREHRAVYFLYRSTSRLAPAQQHPEPRPRAMTVKLQHCDTTTRSQILSLYALYADIAIDGRV